MKMRMAKKWMGAALSGAAMLGGCYAEAFRKPHTTASLQRQVYNRKIMATVTDAAAFEKELRSSGLEGIKRVQNEKITGLVLVTCTDISAQELAFSAIRDFTSVGHAMMDTALPAAGSSPVTGGGRRQLQGHHHHGRSLSGDFPCDVTITDTLNVPDASDIPIISLIGAGPFALDCFKKGNALHDSSRAWPSGGGGKNDAYAAGVKETGILSMLTAITTTPNKIIVQRVTDMASQSFHAIAHGYAHGAKISVIVELSDRADDILRDVMETMSDHLFVVSGTACTDNVLVNVMCPDEASFVEGDTTKLIAGGYPEPPSKLEFAMAAAAGGAAHLWSLAPAPEDVHFLLQQSFLNGVYDLTLAQGNASPDPSPAANFNVLTCVITDGNDLRGTVGGSVALTTEAADQAFHVNLKIGDDIISTCSDTTNCSIPDVKVGNGQTITAEVETAHGHTSESYGCTATDSVSVPNKFDQTVAGAEVCVDKDEAKTTNYYFYAGDSTAVHDTSAFTIKCDAADKSSTLKGDFRTPTCDGDCDADVFTVTSLPCDDDSNHRCGFKVDVELSPKKARTGTIHFYGEGKLVFEEMDLELHMQTIQIGTDQYTGGDKPRRSKETAPPELEFSTGYSDHSGKFTVRWDTGKQMYGGTIGEECIQISIEISADNKIEKTPTEKPCAPTGVTFTDTNYESGKVSGSIGAEDGGCGKFNCEYALLRDDNVVLADDNVELNNLADGESVQVGVRYCDTTTNTCSETTYVPLIDIGDQGPAALAFSPDRNKAPMVLETTVTIVPTYSAGVTGFKAGWASDGITSGAMASLSVDLQDGDPTPIYDGPSTAAVVESGQACSAGSFHDKAGSFDPCYTITLSGGNSEHHTVYFPVDGTLTITQQGIADAEKGHDIILARWRQDVSNEYYDVGQLNVEDKIPVTGGNDNSFLLLSTDSSEAPGITKFLFEPKYPQIVIENAAHDELSSSPPVFTVAVTTMIDGEVVDGYNPGLLLAGNVKDTTGADVDCEGDDITCPIPYGYVKNGREHAYVAATLGAAIDATNTLYDEAYGASNYENVRQWREVIARRQCHTCKQGNMGSTASGTNCGSDICKDICVKFGLDCIEQGGVTEFSFTKHLQSRSIAQCSATTATKEGDSFVAEKQGGCAERRYDNVAGGQISDVLVLLSPAIKCLGLLYLTVSATFLVWRASPVWAC